MQAPDLLFMVMTADVTDDEARACRGSKVSQVDPGNEPPEWRLRDFGFAAYSGPAVPGVREVHFGRKTIWAFASPRENCEEIAVFRRGKDLARKWDGDALREPKVGLDMFFMMRMRQISEETPLDKQFNGEWGFWESFFVPLLDEERTLQSLAAMNPANLQEHFAVQRLPVTCHQRPEGQQVLKVPTDLVVRYQVKVGTRELDEWSELCNKIGEDMILQLPLVVGQKPLGTGSECVHASSEMGDVLGRSQLKKRLLQELKLPVVLTFECDMHVASDWKPDVGYLQQRFDSLSAVYGTNLLNGFGGALARERPDPWHPMARLAASALNKILSRYPDIRSILDVGCGDMAWMTYFLNDHPDVTYVGVDLLPFCLAVNIRRHPKMHFVQTDLTTTRGVEVLPQACDLVFAKEVFNQMVLPDAVDALRRVICTRPRFLLTHVDTASDNTGWERRIEDHRECTPYDYNKPPFSLPYPATEIQRISDTAYFVLYQITPDLKEGGRQKPPPRVEALGIPEAPGPGDDLEAFVTVAEGEMLEPEEWQPKLAVPVNEDDKDAPKVFDELGPRIKASGAKGSPSQELIYEITDPKGVPLDLREGPDIEAARTGESLFPRETFDVAEVVEAADGQRYLRLTDGRGWAFTKSGRDGRLLAEPTTEHKKIKGVRPREFRARCDLIFGKFDQDADGVLNFEELTALMEAGGRNIEEYEAYVGLCTRLGADARVGLKKLDVYKLFEKAPQSTWDEIYRSINPLRQMVRKGAEKLPETFLERPVTNFLFADDDQTAKIYIELNEHLYYGAADAVTADHVQAFFGKQRLEVHIMAPGSYGAQDRFLWKLIITPLTGDIVPEDCSLEVKETVEKAAIQNRRIVVRLAKSKQKHWEKVGQSVTGQRI